LDGISNSIRPFEMAKINSHHALLSPLASNAATAAATACPITAVTQLSLTIIHPMALRLSAGRSASALTRRCASNHHPSAAPAARHFATVSPRHAVRIAPELPNMRVSIARLLLLKEHKR
jgi:hypothetical protein